MKDNKHPHHDLIVEWAKDTSKQCQYYHYEMWGDCDIKDVINSPGGKCRFKPREFQKGHWYPCFLHDRECYVKIWNGAAFYTSSDCDGCSFDEFEFSRIGESLGDLKFRGEK